MVSRYIKAIFVGFFGGFFGGLVGLGGGIIMIPLLVYTIDLPQVFAQGYSLAAVVLTGISGGLAYYKAGSADVAASLFLAFSATIATIFGVRLALTVTSKRLQKYFGFFMLLNSFLLISNYFWSHLFFRFHTWYSRPLLLLSLGSLTGLMSGFFGVGGGTLMVPGLVILLGMSQHLAQGTSLLAMVPTCLAGAFLYFRGCRLDCKLVILLTLGASVGSPFGAKLANSLPEFHLRLLFSILLLLFSAKYLNAPIKKMV